MAEVITFGCRLNTYESEVMRRHAEEAGLTDTFIFNTCAVTAEAARQAGQAIRKVRREHPSAKIIVTGCAAQIDAKRYADMPEVDHVIGNGVKLDPETYRALAAPVAPAKVLVNDMASIHETAAPFVEGFEGLARAFVQVQNGCDHRCTFCIIPYGRGPSRSVPVETIVEQVKVLVDRGYNEIVFTGVDITSYGGDLLERPSLGMMIRRVLDAVPMLPRLRLSSLDPVEVDEDLWHLIGEEPRLMPHLHLSLQAGDDMILKRMKRRHNRADVIAFCERARRLRPEIVFGADIIAGFPTETDEMFANTLELVKQCDLTWLHVFTYSARTGTPAARMPQVHGKIRQERAAQLREAGKLAAVRHLESLVGQSVMALVEQKGVGCAPGFAKMKIPTDAEVGAVVRLKCIGRDGDMAVAEWNKE